MLDEDHAESDECTLANEVHAISGHGLQNLDSILQPSACTGDAECESGTTSNMGVVALTEQLDNPWNLARVLEQQESERRDGSTADVIGRVRDGDMKEFPYSIVVGCSGIGQRERVYTTIAQDRILGRASVCRLGNARAFTYLLSQQLLDHSISLFLPSIEEERQSDRQSTNDLLVLRLPSIG